MTTRFLEGLYLQGLKNMKGKEESSTLIKGYNLKISTLSPQFL